MRRFMAVAVAVILLAVPLSVSIDAEPMPTLTSSTLSVEIPSVEIPSAPSVSVVVTAAQAAVEDYENCCFSGGRAFCCFRLLIELWWEFEGEWPE